MRKEIKNQPKARDLEPNKDATGGNGSGRGGLSGGSGRGGQTGGGRGG
jgi:hypothetical protein